MAEAFEALQKAVAEIHNEKQLTYVEIFTVLHWLFLETLSQFTQQMNQPSTHHNDSAYQ